MLIIPIRKGKIVVVEKDGEFFVLDTLSELKKYKRINLDDTGHVGLRVTALGGIVNRIADDINRISKNQFRLGQQVEDFSEEILKILHEELDIAETYKKWASSRDDLINELNRRSEENEKRIESLVMALISFSDAMDIIYTFISSSGDTDWILQMERVRNSLTIVMAQNNLHEIGNEKYFEDIMHDVVSVVEDRNRDFREIVSVERKGYSYMGRILRKARVIVNNYRKDENRNE